MDNLTVVTVFIEIDDILIHIYFSENITQQDKKSSIKKMDVIQK
jgi:hypothetical protein